MDELKYEGRILQQTKVLNIQTKLADATMTGNATTRNCKPAQHLTEDEARLWEQFLSASEAVRIADIELKRKCHVSKRQAE